MSKPKNNRQLFTWQGSLDSFDAFIRRHANREGRKQIRHVYRTAVEDVYVWSAEPIDPVLMRALRLQLTLTMSRSPVYPLVQSEWGPNSPPGV